MNNKARKLIVFIKRRKNLFMHLMTVFFLALLFILFPLLNLKCFVRFFEGLKTFGYGIFYYFVNLFKDTPVIPDTSYNYIINNLDLSTFLPVNYNSFGSYISAAFFITFNKDYFLSSLNSGSNFINIIRFFLTFGMVIGVLLYGTYVLAFSEKNPEIKGYTKGLKKFLVFKTNVLDKYINKPIKSYIDFIKKNKYYFYIALLIFLFNFNVISFVFEVLGYFMLFVSSFDFRLVYYLVFVSFYTILKITNSIPLPILLVIIYLLFDLIRKQGAKTKLEGFDNKNVSFVENLGVATYIYGPPGCGKTKFMTDLVLSTDKFYRNKAYSIMKEIENLFPNVNFRSLRTYIDWYISKIHIDNPNRILDNRIQLSNEMKTLLEKSIKENRSTLFNFDIKKMKDVWNGNKFISFNNMLQAYSESYYIYINEKPLIFSNYPIRYDSYISNKDYFKVWKNNLFDINKDNFKKESQYSYIIDFDEIRLGNKYSGYAGMIDCGIVAITEIDKERGNRFNLEGLKKTSKTCNLKNDLFNPFWKLGRHPSTVNYYPFLRLYGDLQRTDSLNSDLLESGEMLLYIKNTSKEYTSLKLSQYSTAFLETINSIGDWILTKLKETRNYDSLFSFFVKRIDSFVYLNLVKRSQIYGYKKLDLKISTSRKDDLEETEKETSYVLINKKTYSDRYATDVYREYFEKMLDKKTFTNNKNRNFLKQQYSSIYATRDQFHLQNSFMINDIENCQALKFTGDFDKATQIANKTKKMNGGKIIISKDKNVAPKGSTTKKKGK